MRKIRHVSLLALSVFFLPVPVLAISATITEIMYDLPGTDTGREWVEVKNTGSDDVSFLKWKFFEGNSNHGLTLFQGNATTSVGGFAIIADDTGKFLVDNPGYNGTLYKSSFSLSNTGETLELKLDNASVYQATYTSSLGAEGDGNSLHYVNNAWQAGTPTPGSETFASPGTSLSPDTSTAPDTATGTSTEEDIPGAIAPATPSQHTGSTWVYRPQVFVSAFVPRQGIAGAPILFDAIAVGVKKEPLLNAKYIWNFGDGGVAEGKKVYHTYHYPATYVVMVDASSGEWSATDRKEISITAPELVISNIKEGESGFIEVRNNSKSDVDLSLWLLKSGSGTFTIPQGTLIGSRKSIPFPAVITNLSADPLSTVLLYPNGTPVVVYNAKPTPVEPLPVKAEASPAVTPTVAVASSEEAPREAPIPEPVREVKKTPSISLPAMIPPVASSTQLLGAVGGAEEGSSGTVWVLGVGFLVALSIGGYMAMLRPRPEPSFADKLRQEAERFDIIE